MLVNTRRRIARWTPALLVALAAVTARAGIPDVLDRVPAETPVVIAVGNLEGTMKRLDAMSKSLGKAGENMAAGLWQMNSMISMPGVNKAGSMALAMSLPESAKGKNNADDMDGDDAATGGDEPPGVAIVPVSDYALFVKTFKGDGAATMTQAEFDGRETWIRNLGNGYAVLGNKKDLVEKFDGKAGRNGEHVARMGKVGGKIADATDILILANMAKLEPAMKEAQRQMKTNPAVAMAAMQGGGQAIDALQGAMEAFARDAQTGIVGVGLGEKGITIDFGAQFKDGTGGAKMFQGGGSSGALMAKLPSGDFLFAGAADLSSPQVKAFIREMASKGEGNADPTSMMANLARSIDTLDGQAILMGATDLGNGLMAKTVMYSKTKDPQAFLAASKEANAKLNGVEANGIKFQTSYQSGAREIAGVKVDKWSNKMETDPNSPMAMQVEMMKGFMYGSEGKLSGYAAATEGGVITTMSENSELLKAAIEASKGGKSLAGDPVFSSSQSMLLADRVVEGYIGTKALMETVGGFMAMYGGPELPAPDKVSPIALGMVSDGGGMGIRLAFPMDVIQTIANTAEKMQGAMDDMGEPEPQPEKKKDGGRRF
jgi:hypothetical protein